MKKKLFLTVASILLIQSPQILCNAEQETLSEAQLEAEMNRYNEPVVVMATSRRMPGVLAPGGSTSSGTGTETVGGECMGDYKPALPKKKDVDANTVTSVSYFSQLKIGQKWVSFDHIGIVDRAFGGKRHIAKRDSGIQWFGYDAPPYNDIMLRDFTEDIGDKPFTINVKQAPVRADWHTINGSGVVFAAEIKGGKSTELLSTGADVSTAGTDVGGTVLIPDISGITFSGYAFVATNKFNEVRYYNNVKMEDFVNGSGGYTILLQEEKTCNSQSLTVDYDGSKYTFKIGNKPWKDGAELVVGESVDAYAYDGTSRVSGGSSTAASNTSFTVLPPKSTNVAGAMVDYAEHSCDSLSSVYMFNYTVNGKEYF